MMARSMLNHLGRPAEQGRKNFENLQQFEGET